MISIVERAQTPNEKIQGRILGPLRKILPDTRIEAWCRENRCAPRHRVFGGVVILFGCLLKHMGWTSLRRLEDRIASSGGDVERLCRDGGAFCQARQRLAVGVFQRSLRYLGQWATDKQAELYRGLRVWTVDGSTSVLPNTLPLRKAFGSPKNQNGTSMLTLMRWVVLVCQGSGAVMDVAFGPYTVSEVRLFLLLVQRISSGVLVVGDTTFCSYAHMAVLQQRGSHSLCRRHGTRKDALCERLGRDDELHVWTRPRADRVSVPAHILARLPEELAVRVIRCQLEVKGYRPTILHLCTTLLDPEQYPAEELVGLYAKRWNIEGDLRHLKCHHGLDRLTAKQPGTIVREFLSGVLAYNAVRAILVDSGSKPRALSHTRVRDLIVQRGDMMAACAVVRLPGLYQELLQLVRTCHQEPQERPPEPRVLVRDPRRGYWVIKVDRATWKKIHAA